jgi:hypothetical protein
MLSKGIWALFSLQASHDSISRSAWRRIAASENDDLLFWVGIEEVAWHCGRIYHRRMVTFPRYRAN